MIDVHFPADRFLTVPHKSYLLLNQFLQVLAILDRIKDENENKNAPSGASDNNDQSDDDGDWEGDDPDEEGIIYVK